MLGNQLLSKGDRAIFYDLDKCVGCALCAEICKHIRSALESVLRNKKFSLNIIAENVLFVGGVQLIVLSKH
jgi:Fe-S-cluster-containing dehydrogenase component